MRKLNSLRLLLIIIILLGCSDLLNKPVNTSMLPGVYMANHTQGIDLLILKEEGNYIHIFATFEGQLYIDSSKWELISTLGQQSVRLHHFTSTYKYRVDRPYNEPVTSDKIVKRTASNKIKISIDPDIGIWFVKAGS